MKTYEELSGAQGRRVFFRADRYRARDLFRMSLPELTVNQIPHELDNVSLSGLAAIAPGEKESPVTSKKPVAVRLGLGNATLFEGEGEVVRVQQTPRGAKLGISFRDRTFNVDQVVSKYKEVAIHNDLVHLNTQIFDTEIMAEYRALCTDTLHLLRSYQAMIDRVVRGQEDEGVVADILRECEVHILPQWREIWRRGNQLGETLMQNPPAFQAAKRLTELTLTPDFMPGAIWKRSYEKPFGYPGDFQIMRMVYDWQRTGDSIYEQLLHRLGLEVAECIATRMVMMRNEIATTVLGKQKSGNNVARITSIGCGPAREVCDYLTLKDLPAGVQFTLIDQDHDALALAYEETYPKIMRHRGKAGVNCLQAAFNQLFDTKELFGQLARQDLIYSVGLIDYLKPRRAKAWLNALFDFVAPGGKLIVSNMYKTELSNLWPMEFICDWSVLYRSEAEMRALAEDLPAADVSTALDPTGRVCIMTIEKAAED